MEWQPGGLESKSNRSCNQRITSGNADLPVQISTRPTEDIQPVTVSSILSVKTDRLPAPYIASHPGINRRDSYLAFNTRSNNAPLYLSCLLHNYVPGRSLRSSQSNLLCVPSFKLNFGALSFRVAVPTVWN